MVIHYIIEVELSECYVSWVETLCNCSLYAPKTKGFMHKFMFSYFVYFWLDNIDNYSCNVCLSYACPGSYICDFVDLIIFTSQGIVISYL